MIFSFRLLLLAFGLASVSTGAPTPAQQQQFDSFCVAKAGPGYIAITDANDDFLGCQLKPAPACFYGPYTDPKTGKPGCCGVPGVSFMFDPITRACCPPGRVFKWDATNRIGSCGYPPIPPPPPPPALTCPEANGQRRTVNGVNFKVYCQRAVRVYIPLYQYPSYMARLASTPSMPGITTAQQCLDACARDPKCEGANWIENKSCGFQNKGWGIFGSEYF
ncbi:hypothetical protein H2201_007963 [Coniosporium apollinis]|uniref:Apple domain-containing protein n=1 Tax=Coniosporium apollinis TaxID=61459 RepID=A0ABQ9NHF1_9PEZI|nr:hypothetical protein H2201_007963 [Coniosporium apollinis]